VIEPGQPAFTRLLAVDTSTALGGVAASHGDRVVERRSCVTTHSERLLELVDEALGDIGLRVDELEGVACGAGPGSFTGLRIALATCKGLCFALGRPLVLVSSLEALAARALPGRPAFVALDAYRGELYAARYDVGEDSTLTLVGEEEALAPELLAARIAAVTGPVSLLGGGLLKHRALMGGGQLVDEDPAPRPADLLRLARPRFLAGAVDDLAASVPRYLRPSEAERVKAQRRR
jgi:tRNA threonylcarbamoyladenosine biosynthesis protein TsaB